MKLSRRLGALLAGAVVVAAVAGCGPNQAGAAITYDNGRVTDTTVATQAQQLAEALKIPLDERVTQATVQRLTTDVIVAQAAQRLDIKVSQGDVDALIAEAVKNNGGREALEQAALQQGILPSELPNQARTSLVAQRIAEIVAKGKDQQTQQQAVGDYLIQLGKQINVQVSPRFGTWNADRLALGPVSNDLSKPPTSGLSELVPGATDPGSDGGSGGEQVPQGDTGATPAQ